MGAVGEALRLLGRRDEAIDEYHKAVRSFGGPEMIVGLGHAFAEAGRAAEARNVVNEVDLSYRLDGGFAAATGAARNFSIAAYARCHSSVLKFPCPPPGIVTSSCGTPAFCSASCRRTEC